MRPHVEVVGIDSLILRLVERIDECNMPWLLAATERLRLGIRVGKRLGCRRRRRGDGEHQDGRAGGQADALAAANGRMTVHKAHDVGLTGRKDSGVAVAPRGMPRQDVGHGRVAGRNI